MAKDAYYFPHDSNARQDQKILQMRSVYKSEGYGWYWILIEMLRDDENYELSIEGKYVWNAFAMQMDTNAEKAEMFIKDCISEFNLFESDGKKIWNNSLKRRMLIKEEKSQKARESAKARWEKKQENIENKDIECESNANALETQCDSNASKVKESKVNKIKYTEYVAMTETEYQKLIELHGESLTKEMVDTLSNYKGANGKKYKSDYLAIKNWVEEKVNNKHIGEKKQEPKEVRANGAAYQNIII